MHNNAATNVHFCTINQNTYILKIKQGSINYAEIFNFILL